METHVSHGLPTWLSSVERPDRDGAAAVATTRFSDRAKKSVPRTKRQGECTQRWGQCRLRGPSLSTVLSKGPQLRPDLFLFYFKASASGNVKRRDAVKIGIAHCAAGGVTVPAHVNAATRTLQIQDIPSAMRPYDRSTRCCSSANSLSPVWRPPWRQRGLAQDASCPSKGRPGLARPHWPCTSLPHTAATLRSMSGVASS